MEDNNESSSCVGLIMLVLNILTSIVDFSICVADSKIGNSIGIGRIFFTALAILIYLASAALSCSVLNSNPETNSETFLILFSIVGTLVVIFNFTDGVNIHPLHPGASYIFFISGIIVSLLLIITCITGSVRDDDSQTATEQVRSEPRIVITLPRAEERPPMYPMKVQVEKMDTCEVQQEMHLMEPS